jgi:hypothetical protein
VAAYSMEGLGITGGDHGSRFNHKNYRPLRGASAMDDTFGNDKPFLWLQIDRPTLKIDDEVPLKNKEKFIIVLVFVPVIFALHDAKTYDGVIDLAKRLVIPAVRASSDERRDVHDTQPWKLHLQVGGVWVVFGVAQDKLLSFFFSRARANTTMAVSRAAVPSKPTIICKESYFWA